MIELEINSKNLEFFLKNLRDEDRLEFEQFYDEKHIKNFIDICLDENNQVYMLGYSDYIPVAMGGVYKQKDGIGQVWLLCTKYFAKEKVELFKYIAKKLEKFKQEYSVLYNYIFKTNFKIIKFLKKMDFRVFDTLNANFRLFIFKKGEK